MARVGRFDLDCRVADATDAVALEKELKGCTVLFYCIYGDRGTLVKSTEAAYHAAARAGVRRLVFLSSTVVHGNAPRIGTHDDSELLTDQPFEYNVSKVLAEQRLRQLRTDGAVEVVTLRPPIVFGPRSIWFSANVARDLLTGRAFLVDRGSGICNTVYIDNLVDAMWLAATSDNVVNRDFIITDGQRVTWKDLYDSVAREVGANTDHVLQIDSADVVAGAGRYRQLCYGLLSSLPLGVKRALRTIIPPPVISDAIKALEPRVPDLYIASTQCCGYVLPIDKARQLLGYRPLFTFSEAARRTGTWLRFALGIGDGASGLEGRTERS
jgi:nucleoside-diphosphate-sugar epimerase